MTLLDKLTPQERQVLADHLGSLTTLQRLPSRTNPRDETTIRVTLRHPQTGSVFVLTLQVPYWFDALKGEPVAVDRWEVESEPIEVRG
jgi:hypothetical protein